MATIKVNKTELAECLSNAIHRVIKESKMDYRNGFNKASKKANRDMERDSFGDGFKSYDKPHRSIKDYSRKGKNRFSMDNYDDDFDYGDDMVEESAFDINSPDDDQYYDDGYDTDEIPDIDDYVDGEEYTDTNPELNDPMVTISTDIEQAEETLINNTLEYFDNDIETDVVDGVVVFNAPKSMADAVKKYLRAQNVEVH